ncbi:hypothetical protein H0R92_08835 [Treponema sp. OMZ 840]|uniref:hypothetical protein n=1 Tax=Treponema sp. OMZ 840 TaxID=244313 RepID=UPI003D90731D
MSYAQNWSSKPHRTCGFETNSKHKTEQEARFYAMFPSGSPFPIHFPTRTRMCSFMSAMDGGKADYPRCFAKQNSSHKTEQEARFYAMFPF